MQKLYSHILANKTIYMYLVVGGFVTLISWVAYAICAKYMGISIAASGVVAWIVGVTVAYILNKVLVFESKSWEPKKVVEESIKFVSSRLLTGLLVVVLTPALVYIGISQTLFNIPGFWARAISNVLEIVLNYVASKVFVFKK